MSVRAVFLWHLHQPEYRDPQSGQPLLPWVRLHACRAYTDMAAALERREGVRVVANWAPSLLAQLRAYVEGNAVDLDEQIARREVASLSAAERAHVLKESFSADWDIWVRTVPRYNELLSRRGTELRQIDLGLVQEEFRDQDLLDLQVHFALAWMGFSARNEEPIVKELIARQRGFSEADKRELLDAQRRIAARVLPRWRKLAERGQVEITCSPLYHPILPLLIDSDSARRAMPQATLPPRFQHPEDARDQVVRGLELAEACLGPRPVGMWPSEGSVSPETIELLGAAGVSWCASDEGVLARSELGPESAKLPAGMRAHHRAYSCGQLSMLFRDRELSDFIGFRYARAEAKGAAEDLLRRIAAAGTARGASAEGALVTIALDGENPWEHYPQSGELFLDALYQGLSGGAVASVLPRDELRENPARARISRLHSGSWIDACYRIWIGHPEDNQAWTLLGEAREALAFAEKKGEVPKEALAKAREALFVAEGSDWFWWYGDDFTTENAPEFDALFRRNLAAAYRHLGVAAPERLGRPIISPQKDTTQAAAVEIAPRRLINPVIDGYSHGYYEWSGAGIYRPGQQVGGSMYRGAGVFSQLWYGFSLKDLFLRLDPARGVDVVAPGSELHILLSREPPAFALPWPGAERPGREERLVRMPLFGNGLPCEARDERGALCGVGRCGAIVELSLLQGALGLAPGDRIGLSLRILRDEVEVDRLPRYGELVNEVPARGFERAHWHV